MLPSIIRTVVPAIAGVLIGLAARYGLHLDNAIVSQLITVMVTGLYYWVGRWVEVNVSSRLGGVLLSLGLTKKTPTYR